MKKYLITPVLVCFFLVGCSSEDGSHDHDHDHSLLEHDHSLLHDHNLVLEEEVGSNKTLEEKSKLLKVGMTIEEVKFVMGFPDGINIILKTGNPIPPLGNTFYYYFPITNEDHIENQWGQKRTRRQVLRLSFVNFGCELLLETKPFKLVELLGGHLEVSE